MLRASGALFCDDFVESCIFIFMRVGFDFRQYFTQISPYVIFYYLTYNSLPNYNYFRCFTLGLVQ